MLIIFVCLLTAIISCRYASFYAKTRMTSFRGPDSFVKTPIVVLVCALYNLAVGAAAGRGLSYRELFVLFLMMLLADIDILIKKIPTELLVALAAAICFVKIPEIEELPDSAAVIFIGVVFYIFRRKIGIALYDILLFLLLGIFVYPIDSQIKYTAVFLILWGISGVLVRSFRKQEKTVPLAPCIILSYFICCGLNRL